MKTMLIAGVLGSSLLASGAMAQSSNQPSSTPNSSQFITQLSAGSMLLSDLMDQDVVGADNKEIGEVEDVVLDRDGKVAAIVIEVDKGIGDRTVALPMTAFQMGADAQTTGSVAQGAQQNTGSSNASNSDNMRLMLNMPLDQLKSAPEFDEDND